MPVVYNPLIQDGTSANERLLLMSNTLRRIRGDLGEEAIPEIRKLAEYACVDVRIHEHAIPIGRPLHAPEGLSFVDVVNGKSMSRMSSKSDAKSDKRPSMRPHAQSESSLSGSSGTTTSRELMLGQAVLKHMVDWFLKMTDDAVKEKLVKNASEFEQLVHEWELEMIECGGHLPVLHVCGMKSV